MVVPSVGCVDFGFRPQLARPIESDDGSLLFALDDVKCLRSSSCSFQASSVEVSYGCSEASKAKCLDGVFRDDVAPSEGPTALLGALKQAVHANLRGVQDTREECILHVGECLADQGFHSQVVLESSHFVRRHASSVPSMPFRPFILVTGYTWGNVSSETMHLQAVVDFDFKAKFEIYGASHKYSAATDLLPEVFVGCPSDLQVVVTRMAKMLKKEFVAKSMSLPPWRSTSALLGIWFPLDGRQGKTFTPPVLLRQE